MDPLLSAINPILLADHPEDVKLWFPSALPPTSRNVQCIDGLPQLKYRIWFAQAANALHDVCLFYRLLRVLTVKSQAHITNTQRTGTRTRSVFDKARAKLARAIATYCVAWKAITDLAPSEEFGLWKKILLELRDCDIRGPGREDSEPSTSRFVQSWIWTATIQTSTSAEDPDLDVALRIEWCKAQEQAKRYKEEVELVVEEMRRTLVTFELNAREWDQWATSPSFYSSVEGTMATGAIAYAHKQASIQRRLVGVFINDWYKILEDQPLATSWLSKYTRPPKNQRHCLVCNVRLYHPTSSVTHPDAPHANDISPDGIDAVFPSTSFD